MMKIDSARISFMRICRDLFYNLYEKLKDADCINLQEHSSFTQALNLKLDDKLISILNEDKVLAPYSLTLPIDFFTKYSPHNHLFLKKGKNDSVVLFLPKNLEQYIFTSENCEDLKLNLQLKIKFKDDFFKIFFTYLNKNKRQNSLFELIFDKRDPFCQEKYEKLKINSQSANNLNIQSLSRDLSDFLGLGSGLTPSGDDFILGFLFIFTLCNAKSLSYISEEIKKQLTLTNDISATMLKHALSKRFNLNLIKTANYLQKINPANFNDCIDGIFSLKNYGHSSWQDCLLGIYTALLLLKA